MWVCVCVCVRVRVCGWVGVCLCVSRIRHNRGKLLNRCERCKRRKWSRMSALQRGTNGQKCYRYHNTCAAARTHMSGQCEVHAALCGQPHKKGRQKSPDSTNAANLTHAQERPPQRTALFGRQAMPIINSPHFRLGSFTRDCIRGRDILVLVQYPINLGPVSLTAIHAVTDMSSSP